MLILADVPVEGPRRRLSRSKPPPGWRPAAQTRASPPQRLGLRGNRTGRDCYVDSDGCIGVVMMAREMALRVREKSLAARERVAPFDWEHILHELDAQGNAVLDRVLTPGEGTALAELYPGDG